MTQRRVIIPDDDDLPPESMVTEERDSHETELRPESVRQNATPQIPGRLEQNRTMLTQDQSQEGMETAVRGSEEDDENDMYSE